MKTGSTTTSIAQGDRRLKLSTT
jgi:hypothetical protein